MAGAWLSGARRAGKIEPSFDLGGIQSYKTAEGTIIAHNCPAALRHIGGLKCSGPWEDQRDGRRLYL
jgi:hypothetical protein